MKSLQQLESLGLLTFTVFMYSQIYSSGWGLFAALFFVPDISFLGYVFNKHLGAYWYNSFHHQGVIVIAIFLGWMLGYPLVQQIGIIFLAHSFFDRALGYGLKYTDSFHHTHLGWIGKNKTDNKN